MIEIGESYSLAKQLNKVLNGKRIVRVITASTPHKFTFYYGDPGLYEGKLTGKVIGQVEYFGGFVEIQVEDMLIQLSENPQIRYFDKEDKYPLKHQLCLIFEDKSRLYISTQLYAGIYVCRPGENENAYYLVAKNSLSPLSKEFDYTYFMDIVHRAKGSLTLKALLATKQRIPGVGNGVIQDILYLSHLHPKTKAEDLCEEQWQCLFDILKHTLTEMAQKGGRDTEKNIYGEPGGYQTYLSSNTWKEPCAVCGRDIVKQTYLGGAIYFCPNCQPLAE